MSAGNKTTRRRLAFSGSFPKEPVLGFWILVGHYQVIKTPLYDEPGEKVKRNNCTRWEGIYDFDFLIYKSGLRATRTNGVT